MFLQLVCNGIRLNLLYKYFLCRFAWQEQQIDTYFLSYLIYWLESPERCEAVPTCENPLTRQGQRAKANM